MNDEELRLAEEKAAARLLQEKGLRPELAIPIAQIVVRTRHEGGFYWLIATVSDLWGELNRKARQKQELARFSERFGKD